MFCTQDVRANEPRGEHQGLPHSVQKVKHGVSPASKPPLDGHEPADESIIHPGPTATSNSRVPVFGQAQGEGRSFHVQPRNAPFVPVGSLPATHYSEPGRGQRTGWLQTLELALPPIGRWFTPRWKDRLRSATCHDLLRHGTPDVAHVSARICASSMIPVLFFGKQRFQESGRIERFDVFECFAYTHELDGDPKLLTDCDDDSALGRPIEFR